MIFYKISLVVFSNQAFAKGESIMAGTSEGGKKSAETRGHESLSQSGRKGGEHSHGGKEESSTERKRSDEEMGKRSKNQ